MKKVFAIIIMLLMLTGCTSAEQKEYEAAIAAYDSGDYETAISMFDSLGDYEDSYMYRDNAVNAILNNSIIDLGESISDPMAVDNIKMLCVQYGIAQDGFAQLEQASTFETLLKAYTEEYCQSGAWRDCYTMLQSLTIVSDESMEECLITYGRWACVDVAEDYVKETLKSPRSYYRYKASVTAPNYKEDEGYYIVNVYLDYGAENSFGAEVTDSTQICVHYYIDVENRTVEFDCIGDALDMLKDALGG